MPYNEIFLSTASSTFTSPQTEPALPRACALMYTIYSTYTCNSFRSTLRALTHSPMPNPSSYTILRASMRRQMVNGHPHQIIANSHRTHVPLTLHAQGFAGISRGVACLCTYGALSSQNPPPIPYSPHTSQRRISGALHYNSSTAS